MKLTWQQGKIEHEYVAHSSCGKVVQLWYSPESLCAKVRYPGKEKPISIERPINTPSVEDVMKDAKTVVEECISTNTHLLS